ncbi:hypothetical protein F5Y16DRAFT_139681 [Xylariaceae sp. FL0255]|nr:hypothetical protein F5Y16DRAFT_139681 [Xylariaceae sp. FL0255]
MFPFIFVFLAVSASAVNIAATGSLDFDLHIQTSSNTNHYSSQPGDRWLPSITITTTRPIISLHPSHTMTSTPSVIQTTSRHVCAIGSGQLSSSANSFSGMPCQLGTFPTPIPTRATSWNGNSTMISKTTISPNGSPTKSFSSGVVTIVPSRTNTTVIARPTATASGGLGRGTLVQQAWPSVAYILIALSLSYF